MLAVPPLPTGQVRAADHSKGDLPYPGQRGHQNAHEQCYDRNNDQQLNQCKTFFLHLFLLFLFEIRSTDRFKLRFGLHFI